MTTRLHATFAVLIALLITLPLIPNAFAQDLDATTAKLNLEDLKGVDAAISRSYAMSINDLVEAAGSDTPVPVVRDGPILMLALVAQFDTRDHASDATDTLHDRLLKQASDEKAGFQLEATETEGLGDTAWEFSGTQAASRSPVSVSGLLVQDNNWVYLALVISDNESGPDAALGLVRFSLVTRPSADPAIYDHTGTSRGGIWAKLPAVGDTIALREGENRVDALSGTQPVYDNQLLPPAPPEE